MKAVTTKSDLLRAIPIAERATNTKSSLPILSTMKLEVSGFVLTVSATDLELGMVARVYLEKGEDGAVAVGAKQFVEFVRAVPDGPVSLETGAKGSPDHGKLIARAGKSVYKTGTFPEHEFPALPSVEPKFTLTMSEAELRAALERVAAASATDDTRPILCSVLWRITEDGTLTLVATDTHRLHLGTCEVESVSGSRDLLVPGRACKELVRLLHGDGTAEVTADDNQIQVKTSGAILISRLTDGTYPKYERVVPDLTHSLTVNRKDLAQVVGRASIVGKEDANRVLLQFEDDGVLRVTSSTSDGAAEEELAFEGSRNDTQDRLLATNFQFLLSALQACPDEEVKFYHNAANRPILLHGVNGRHRFQAVVMPMLLQ